MNYNNTDIEELQMALNKIITSKLSDLTEELADLWNKYCEENSYDEKIYPMDSYMINDMLSGKEPIEILRLAEKSDGCFHEYDDWMFFGPEGEPLSCFDLDTSPIDVDSLDEWLMDRPEEMDFTTDEEECIMDTFIDWMKAKMESEGISEEAISGIDKSAVYDELSIYNIPEMLDVDWYKLYADVKESLGL